MPSNAESEFSGDDLDIIPSKRKESLQSGVEGWTFDILEDATHRDGHHEDEDFEGSMGEQALGRVSWSSGDDGEATYKKFKNRKLAKLKRAGRSSKQSGQSASNKKRKRGRMSTNVEQSGKDISDKESVSKDDVENDLPGYLLKRRALFDKRIQSLAQAGLRLPPSYDDVEFSDDEHLEDLREKPDFPNTIPQRDFKDVQLPYSLGLIPAPLAQWLRDYQIDGVSFLHELFVYQKGGILGDDMGLGKTIQVIAFLTVAFGKTSDERDAKRMRKIRRSGEKKRWYPRVLLICPGGLLANWQAELRKWGWWHIDVYHGSRKDEALDAAGSGMVEILMTTYATYRARRSAINMVEWDCVIADECHIIKEKSSETTIAMNEVNALCRIGLTGTAIQNNYEELWCLLNWTNPGKFGSISTWKRVISEPLRIGQSHEATIYQLSRARKTAKKLVQNLLPEFFLRRMKSLIAHQLPKKTDRVVFCPLTETQAEAYKNFLDSEIVQSIRTSTEPCECGSGKKAGWCCSKFLSDDSRWQEHVFPAIWNLQRICNHLASLIPQGTDQKEHQKKALETLQTALPDRWQDLYRTRDSILNYANPEFCGKWKVLKKLLRFWHVNGDKVLVFSLSTRLLRMLQVLFNHTSYNVSYLDGSMSYVDRAKAVDDFNSDPTQFVFLISTKAGGVGLNITSANKVVIFDPNWNPSYDLQAQDRAYRIGQTRDVEVFRLISAGTIEEIVYARQIYKQQQANIGYNASMERRYFKGVQNRNDRKGEIFGLGNLFSYGGENIVLRDIINATNVAESKAGVSIADLGETELTNVDDDSDEHLRAGDERVAMKQLATQIADGITQDGPEKPSKTDLESKKADPILAILASAGVEYTHENSEIIGSSTVEARLSRRAEEAGNDLDLNGRHVFEPSHQQADAFSTCQDAQGTRPHKYKYHPPIDVMKRQFCRMARRFGFKDATEFALVVEGWTASQRRSCLEQFYKELEQLDEAVS